MTNVVVSASIPRFETYTASDGQTEFAIPFAYFHQSDLRIDVWRDGVLALELTGWDEEETFDADAHFEADPSEDANVEAGVSGTATIPACEEDDEVIVYAATSPEREAQYTTTGEFRAERVNREMNRRVAVERELVEDLARTVRVPVGEMMNRLAGAAERAGKFLYFLEGSGQPALALPATFSPDIVPLGAGWPDRLQAPSDMLTAIAAGAAGTGLGNDEDAIQAALDGGYDVWLDHGRTFNFQEINVPAGRRLMGPRSAVLQQIEASGRAITVNDNVRVSGFTLDGGNSAATIVGGFESGHSGIYGVGTALTPLESIALDDLHIRNFGEHGAYLKFVNRQWVTRCHVKRTGWMGIFFDSPLAAWAELNYVEDVFPGNEGSLPFLNAYGIVASRSDGNRIPLYVVIDRNIVTDVTGWEGIDIHDGKHCSMSRNLVIDCSQCIVYENHSPGSPGDDIRIDNNIGLGWSGATKVRDGTTFYKQAGIIANGGNTNEVGTTLSLCANDMTGMGDTRNPGAGAGAIRFRNWDGVVASDNHMRDCYRAGMSIGQGGTGGVTNLIAANNNVVNVTAVDGVCRGFEVDTLVEGLAPGNRVSGLETGLEAFFQSVSSTRYLNFDGSEHKLASGIERVGPGLPALNVNGQFDFWQAATTISASGYTADMLRAVITGDTSTIDRQTFTLGQTDVPDGPRYFLRAAVTGAAGAANRTQLVTYLEDVRRFDAKWITLSFWARRSAGSGNMSTEFAQSFGTGGSPSANVNTLAVTKHTLTTSWQKFRVTTQLPSIAAKTLGSDENSNAQLNLWISAGSDFNARTDSLGTQTVTVDIANVKIEFGRAVTPWVRQRQGEILAACQRVFKRFDVRTENGSRPIFFGTTMRAVPAVTPSVGVAANISVDGFELSHSAAADSNVTADARF